MDNLWWLTLSTLAVAAVWWLGWRSGQRHVSPDIQNFPSHYFQGLNYLLNEQPDKAIEVFIKLLEVESDTIETHFALGNLFRRRGEVDRALRIHQNLIARPILTRAQRTQALYELGLDYMRAGILSRAESVFLQLVDDESIGIQSLHQLVDIYQQEREWKKAIEAMEKLQRNSGQNKQPVIAQYYCELAEIARQSANIGEARRLIDVALEHDPGCVRASLLQGELAMQDSDQQGALAAYARIEKQDPDYLPDIITPVIQAYERLDRPEEGLDYLLRLYHAYGGVSALLAVTDYFRKKQGDASATAFLMEQMNKRPSMRGLERLIALIEAQSAGPAQQNLQVIHKFTSGLLMHKPAYRCRHCGFNAKSMHWQCPGCKTWASLKPTQTLEGD